VCVACVRWPKMTTRDAACACVAWYSRSGDRRDLEAVWGQRGPATVPEGATNVVKQGVLHRPAREACRASCGQVSRLSLRLCVLWFTADYLCADIVRVQHRNFGGSSMSHGSGNCRCGAHRGEHFSLCRATPQAPPPRTQLFSRSPPVINIHTGHVVSPAATHGPRCASARVR